MLGLSLREGGAEGRWVPSTEDLLRRMETCDQPLCVLVILLDGSLYGMFQACSALLHPALYLRKLSCLDCITRHPSPLVCGLGSAQRSHLPGGPSRENGVFTPQSGHCLAMDWHWSHSSVTQLFAGSFSSLPPCLTSLCCSYMKAASSSPHLPFVDSPFIGQSLLSCQDSNSYTLNWACPGVAGLSHGSSKTCHLKMLWDPFQESL